MDEDFGSAEFEAAGGGLFDFGSAEFEAAGGGTNGTGTGGGFDLSAFRDVLAGIGGIAQQAGQVLRAFGLGAPPPRPTTTSGAGALSQPLVRVGGLSITPLMLLVAGGVVYLARR